MPHQTSDTKKSYYKYRPLYSDKQAVTPNEFTQKLIEDHELYYATPSSFNDPFDCNLSLHTKGSTDKDWIGYFNDLISKDPLKKPIYTYINKNKSWKNDPNLIETSYHNLRNELYEKSSVLCLSKKNNSIPMFSYYADDHCGIAVELTFADDEIPCGLEQKSYGGNIVKGDVEYLNVLPELNYLRLRNTKQLVYSLMFTKFDEWKHEEEFRVFRRNIPASSVKYKPEMLKRIIFGARTGDKEITLVKSWLKNHPTPVILAKANKSKGKFKLKIKFIEKFTP